MEARRADPPASQGFRPLGRPPGTGASLNPFDLGTAEQLGQVEYERRQFHAALVATMDAFLLLADAASADGERLRRKVRTLRHALGWESQEVVQLFHERQEALRLAYDRLEWRASAIARRTR